MTAVTARQRTMKLCISTRKMAPRGYLLRAQQVNSCELGRCRTARGRSDLRRWTHSTFCRFTGRLDGPLESMAALAASKIAGPIKLSAVARRSNRKAAGQLQTAVLIERKPKLRAEFLTAAQQG